VGKKCEKRFSYSHVYRDKKIAGQKRAKQIIQKKKKSAGKKIWEKNRRKEVQKNYFYINTNNVTKK